MHGIHRDEDAPMAEMNLIPLIDIALTLLIIMMVTTAFIRHPGVALKLPETATREGAPETKRDYTIVITADGQYYVDAQPKSAATIHAELRAVAARNKSARILVKGDRNVPYARVMEIMDVVRQAGLTRVVLPTDPRPKPETAAVGVGRPTPEG